MKKIYIYIYTKIEDIQAFRKKHPRIFILTILSVNILVSFFLFFFGITSHYRLIFLLTFLCIICLVFFVKDAMQEFKPSEDFWYIKNKREVEDLSYKRIQYLLKQKSNFNMHNNLPFINIYTVSALMVLPGIVKSLDLPKLIYIILFLGNLLFIIYLIVSRFTISKAFSTLPKELQYPSFKIKKSRFFTREVVKETCKKAKMLHQKSKEIRLFKVIGILFLCILMSDAFFSFIIETRAYMGSPASQIDNGWWTTNRDAHAKATELTHAGYDVVGECGKTTGVTGNVDEEKVFEMYKKHYDSRYRMLYTKGEYDRMFPVAQSR